jgi:hypothetical protein
LNSNSNNFQALSYQAKALMGLKLNKEAAEVIKKALSIKFSKSLLNNLKEIEEKEVSEKNFHVDEIVPKEEESVNGSSFFNSLWKFFRVVFISSYNFVKRNRSIILLLLILCLVILRKKINMKLGSLLRVMYIYKNK